MLRAASHRTAAMRSSAARLQASASPSFTPPPAAAATAATASGADSFTLTIHDSLAAAERPWRELERTAILSPYQRFDWLTALHATRGPGAARHAIAVLSDGARPVALLPLAISRRPGLRTAAVIGADIGNTGWLPMTPEAAARLTPAALRALFATIAARAGGIDVLTFHNLPAHWRGLDNPLLALPHQPAPDHFYIAPIGADGSGRIAGKRLRNVLRGKRRLEEVMGPVVLRRAETVAEIARVHAVFLEQRGARFAQMGVPNVFAEPWFVAFFKHAAATSIGSDRPALRFHALYAGDEIVATSCGTCAGAHYSQYINSTSVGPAAKYSLMGILISELLVELAATGVTSFDMGLGDFDYKNDWTERQEVFDCVVPLSAAGRLVAPLLLARRGLKRRIKQNPQLFGALKRLRALTLPRPPASAAAPEEPE